jgi:hypothetical protein
MENGVAPKMVSVLNISFSTQLLILKGVGPLMFLHVKMSYEK